MRHDLVVLMVHGTWGRGFFPNSRPLSRRQPRWYEKGGVFRERLVELFAESGVVTTIEFIEWSGSNSFREREKAAMQLARLIDAHSDEAPDVPILLVGHSHGGNAVARSLSHIKSAAANIYAATLATPFLEVFRTEVTSSQQRALVGLFFLLCGLSLLGFSMTLNLF